MQTGIVILNYNTFDDLKKSVESIKSNVKSSYKIYIVDNNSELECVEKIQHEFNTVIQIELLFLKSNRGYSSGNNVGIKKAIDDGMDYILIMNPDVVLHNDIVSIMSSSINEKIQCVGPKIFDINNHNGQRLRKNYSFKYSFFNKRPLSILGKILGIDNDIQYDENKELIFSGCLSGCCFMMSAQLFKDINGFDDNVFLYYEEHIIGKKLQEREKLCLYNPDAVITHMEGKSTGRISNAFVHYHLYASEYYLLKKYCNINNVQSMIIKNIRLLLFDFMALCKKGDYMERYKLLKKKFVEIDNSIYKITF